jgi:hypothetical protein
MDLGGPILSDFSWRVQITGSASVAHKSGAQQPLAAALTLMVVGRARGGVG